jgi:hypothetical protein
LILDCEDDDDEDNGSETMKANLKRSTIFAAYGVAICADMIQMGVLPITTEGFLSPADDVLDVATCIILTLLVGWHLAFLPSFLVKLIPIGDLAPTWTLAVFIAMRSRRETAAKDISGAGNQKSETVDIKPLEEKPPLLKK